MGENRVSNVQEMQSDNKFKSMLLLLERKKVLGMGLRK